MRRWATVLAGILAVLCATAAYPPAKPTVGVVSGVASTCGSLVVEVAGYTPGESVLITMGPVTSSLVAGTDGSGRVTIGVPTTVGIYTLTAVGQTSGLSATSQVTIAECAAGPGVPATTAPATTAARNLPVSGSEVNRPVRIALGLLALGIALVVFGYRRRQLTRSRPSVHGARRSTTQPAPTRR